MVETVQLFIESTMSVKSNFSSREAWYSALSQSACGVG